MGIYEHLHYTRGPDKEHHTEVGDWIKVTWMEGQPSGEVIGHDDCGWPIIEHPKLSGLGPMTVDVYDVVARKADQALFVGDGL